MKLFPSEEDSGLPEVIGILALICLGEKAQSCPRSQCKKAEQMSQPSAESVTFQIPVDLKSSELYFEIRRGVFVIRVSSVLPSDTLGM